MKKIGLKTKARSKTSIFKLLSLRNNKFIGTKVTAIILTALPMNSRTTAKALAARGMAKIGRQASFQGFNLLLIMK